MSSRGSSLFLDNFESVNFFCTYALAAYVTNRAGQKPGQSSKGCGGEEYRGCKLAVKKQIWLTVVFV